MKRYIFLFLAIGHLSSQLLGQKSDSKKNIEISVGERVFIEDKGISIAPPIGWEVQRDYPSLSLFLQIPQEKGVYQRNIQIMTFEGGIYIDVQTAEEFSKKIVKKYSALLYGAGDFQLINYELIKLQDGRDAILFYTDFVLREQAMMQAHILTSSSDFHYLTSYMDLKEHFEGEDTTVWDTSWECMTSVQLTSRAPVRYQKLLVILIIFVVFFGGLFLFSSIRRRKENVRRGGSSVSFDDDFDAVDGKIHSDSSTLASGEAVNPLESDE